MTSPRAGVATASVAEGLKLRRSPDISRTTRNSRTRVSSGLSRERSSSPGVAPAKTLAGGPACAKDAMLRCPAVFNLFSETQGVPPHRSVRQGQSEPPTGLRQKAGSTATLGCAPFSCLLEQRNILSSKTLFQFPIDGRARLSTFWRYAKMTIRERVSDFAHTDAVPPSAPSRHSSAPWHPARNSREYFSVCNLGAVRCSAAQTVE
jgi:hypothetical protein